MALPKRASSEPVTVITGASAGVGRALAHRFAYAGTPLALLARDRPALEDVAAEVEERGGRAMVIAADVADPQAVLSAANAIEQQMGPIGTWVNNAMVTVFSPLSRMTPNEFHRVTEVNYLGVVYGTMAALEHMRPRNRGTIVQIGSALAYRGIPLQSAYCGAKHAIRGFTDSVRSELLHDGASIRLTTVHLPAVNTPQFDWARTHLDRQPRPVAPVFSPQTVADDIYRAADGRRREVWVGTNTAKVILGNMLVPRLLDRVLARRAHAGQKRAAKVSPDRRDNLFDPVSELHGLEGAFGNEARREVAAAGSGRIRIGATVLSAGLAAATGALAGRLFSRLTR